jgi:hypothetical protein
MSDKTPWQPRVGLLIADRFDVRPWPVDPRQYPLSGPSRGPVYSPQETALDAAERAMKERMAETLYGPRRKRWTLRSALSAFFGPIR